MKSIIMSTLCAAISCIATTVFAQQATLNGEIKGMGDGEIKIYYYEGATQKTSEVKVASDKFVWTANMPQPQKVTIMFPKRAVWLHVQSGDMQLKGNIDSLSNIKLIGSKIQDEAYAYEKLLAPFAAQEGPLYQKYGKVSKEEQLALEQKLVELRGQKRAVTAQYITEHPNSYLSLILVTDRATMGAYDDIQPAFNKLSADLKQSPEGQRLAARLVVLKRSKIGEQMLNFTQNDVDGKPVTFDAFKGKYVLVDFWASWCGPCRAENPNVLKAYNTYKDKNFTVLGISLDDKADNWKKAIKDDAMPWTQLSDLKGFKNEVSTYYGIMGIPSTLLIDPQGKIIAKDLRGEMLNQKLAELFNAKTK